MYTGRLTPGPRTKATVSKVPKPCVKKTHLLNLNHLLERQKLVGTFFRDRDTGKCHFKFLLTLLLPALRDTIFASLPLAHQLRWACPGPAHHSSPTTAGRHVQPTEGTPTEHLALMARGLHFWAPWVRNRELVLGMLPPPGHCTNTRLNHNPSPFVKRLILVLELQLED